MGAETDLPGADGLSGIIVDVWWPVLLGDEPMREPWVVGGVVAARLVWCDRPELPDGIALRDLVVRTRPLPHHAGQLLSAGGWTAARTGHGDVGEGLEASEVGQVTVSGCLRHDPYFATVEPTPGVVRRLRRILRLYDRGPQDWIPRPGAVRTVDVPDTAPPNRPSEAPTGPVRFISPEEQVREFGDRLPPQEWRQRGFLVDLEMG